MSRIDRPYIFCHMMTSLDGKIMGSYMETPQGSVAGDVFYKIAFGQNPFYRHQGWLSGRVTTDDNFTFYKKPTLDLNAAPVPAGDFIAQPDFGMFYVSIDPHGKLGWESATLHYGDTTAHVIEVLTTQTSNAYKAFLRKLGISYIVAGEHELDYAVALAKLKYKFHIETLMLGGGGVLIWSFLQANMCDESQHRSGCSSRRRPGHSAALPCKRRAFRQSPAGIHSQRSQSNGWQFALASLYCKSVIS